MSRRSRLAFRLDFIEIRKGGDGEIVVRANREGLIHIARICLSLATRPAVGNHHHFDEAGLVEHCDMPLILALAEADWEYPFTPTLIEKAFPA